MSEVRVKLVRAREGPPPDRQGGPRPAHICSRMLTRPSSEGVTDWQTARPSRRREGQTGWSATLLRQQPSRRVTRTVGVFAPRSDPKSGASAGFRHSRITKVLVRVYVEADHGAGAPTRYRASKGPCDLEIRHVTDVSHPLQRSEERRVGKECRSRWSPYH